MVLTPAACRLPASGDPGWIDGVTTVNAFPLVRFPVTVTLAPAADGLGMTTDFTLCAVTSLWNWLKVSGVAEAGW